MCTVITHVQFKLRMKLLLLRPLFCIVKVEAGSQHLTLLRLIFHKTLPQRSINRSTLDTDSSTLTLEYGCLHISLNPQEEVEKVKLLEGDMPTPRLLWNELRCSMVYCQRWRAWALIVPNSVKDALYHADVGAFPNIEGSFSWLHYGTHHHRSKTFLFSLSLTQEPPPKQDDKCQAISANVNSNALRRSAGSGRYGFKKNFYWKSAEKALQIPLFWRLAKLVTGPVASYSCTTWPTYLILALLYESSLCTSLLINNASKSIFVVQLFIAVANSCVMPEGKNC